MRRAARFFFMHIGSFVAVILYFVLCEGAKWSPDGVAHALVVALVVMTAYVALARSQGELKQFDAGIMLLFAVGVVATRLGIESVAALYYQYSATLLFLTLGLTGLIPLLLRRETFVYYFARRQIPRWQLRLPEFGVLSRVITSWWIVLFFTASGLAASAPRDPRFTALYPNLLIFGLGMTSTFWLPPLFFRFRPPSLPHSVEPLVMGMPMVFDRNAARDVRASIQFCVTGDDPGDYHIRIAGGRCVSTEGRTPAPDLTIYTPDKVWVRIAHGELDGGQALAEGLYRAEGDLAVLAKIGDWFPTRR